MDFETQNKVVRYLAYGLFLIALCGVCWLVFGGDDVHDNGGGTSDVGTALERARDEQRNAESHIVNVGRELDSSVGRIGTIEKRVDDAESAVRESQERSGECASIVADSESRLADCKRILESVRGRASET